MKAVQMIAPRTVEIVDVEDPVVTSDMVPVTVHRIGLCGTDLRTYTGENPIVEYPRIFGHEIGATLDVPATISGTRYDAGTVVTLNPYTTCGTCPSCRCGRSNACQFNETLGNQRDGAAMERYAIPSDRLYPLPGLDVDHAVCVEPLSVGFHAAARGEVCDSDTVVVLGCGMIGLGAIGGAAARGARVVAVDLDDAKLETARQMGARETINGAREDVTDRVRELTGGEGASVVIEAIGLPATYRQAIELVAFTGRVVYIGYASEDVAFTTKYFVAKELDIRGSRNAQDRDFRSVITAIGTGVIDVSHLISQRHQLDRAADAFSFWASNPNKVTKVVLELP